MSLSWRAASLVQRQRNGLPLKGLGAKRTRAYISPCGTRNTVRANAFPPVFRPLRKLRPPYLRHWRREAAILGNAPSPRRAAPARLAAIAVPGPASRRPANGAAAEKPCRLLLPPAAAARFSRNDRGGKKERQRGKRSPAGAGERFRFHNDPHKGRITRRDGAVKGESPDGAGLSGDHHLMAPVMPWANCFCRMKKTMTVGSEQNSTPSISTP